MFFVHKAFPRAALKLDQAFMLLMHQDVDMQALILRIKPLSSELHIQRLSCMPVDRGLAQHHIDIHP